jgi:hypothetical protein
MKVNYLAHDVPIKLLHNLLGGQVGAALLVRGLHDPPERKA